jgi:hypothetical protein
MADFQWEYMRSNRGVIKYIQVALGLFVGSLFCFEPFGEIICMQTIPMGYTTWLNIIVALLNVAWFVAYLTDVASLRIERYFISEFFVQEFGIHFLERILGRYV